MSAMPSEHLLSLADCIEDARNQFLDDFPDETKKAILQGVLWNDKGTFAPALRELVALRAQLAKSPLPDGETVAWRIPAKDIQNLRTVLNMAANRNVASVEFVNRWTVYLNKLAAASFYASPPPVSGDVRTVIAEMIEVATGDDDSVLAEWTCDNKATIDKWQMRLSRALLPSGEK
jgi:hypothetical protein